MFAFPVFVAAFALAQPPEPPTPPVRKLTVTPAAEPRPALRYELLPPLREKQPGNAALAYYRAFAARPQRSNDPDGPATNARIEQDWRDGPLDQLPRDAVKKRLEEYSAVFREVERATVADQCNWEMLPRIRSEGVNALLEVQHSRDIQLHLSLRTRLALADDRYDEAAKSLRAALQMAKHVGESPTNLQLLVGIALEAIALERVEDWIARPGSPNLYWSLTYLPRPFLDPRPGFEGEAVFLESTVPNMARLRAGPLPKEDAPKIIEGIVADMRSMGGAGGYEPSGLEKAVGQLGFAGYVAWKYPTARKELIAAGRPEAEVDRMAGAQVVFLASLERFLTLRDDQWKWLGMPYHIARPHLKDLDRRTNRIIEEGNADVFFRVFAMTLPASERVLAALARTDRKLAFLRAVEALRLYAAGHGGSPPAALADAPVPVPDDPVTGKPFGYEAKGGTAVLTAPAPDGEPATATNSLRYEITFRSAGK